MIINITAENLKVTPQEVENKANEIEGIAKEMSEFLGIMNTTVDKLRTYWSSTSGDAYVGRYLTLSKEAGEALQYISEYIKDLRDAAILYEKLENDLVTGVENTTDPLDVAGIFE